jgi:hypothetical protein
MYGKVFASMYDGTLATKGPWQALVTFQQMIVLADKDGVVDMTADAIARRTSIPREIIEIGIKELSEPDDESRSPVEDGRRIVLLEPHRTWGWQIVNYAKYAALRSAEERREYMRLAQAAHRAKVKADIESSKIVMTRQDKSSDVKKSTDVSVSVPVTAIQGGEPPRPPPQPPSTGVASGTVARKRAPKPQPVTSDVWASYSQAYRERYKVDPVRNAKTNAQLAQLVTRLGGDEAPAVARHYVANRNALYVASKHCTDLLLRDCEKLRTEWATGEITHMGDAQQTDRLGSVNNQAARVTAILDQMQRATNER